MIELYSPAGFCKGFMDVDKKDNCETVVNIDMGLIISNEELQNLKKDLEKLLEKYCL
jgi:hypothetical protein